MQSRSKEKILSSVSYFYIGVSLATKNGIHEKHHTMGMNVNHQ